MNGFLKFLKYGLVLIVALLVVGLIVCGCLVLVPGFNIFGVSYVTFDNKTLEKQIAITEIEEEHVDTVRINTGLFNVNLNVVDTDEITNGASQLTLRLKRNLSGFVVGDEEARKVDLLTSFDSDGATKLLNITIKQPQKAWLFPTTTELNMFMPQTPFGNKNVEIITGSGQVNVGAIPTKDASYPNLSIKALSINSESGPVNIGCVNFVNPLTITKEKGDISAYTDLGVNTTISIKSGFGSVSLKGVGSQSSPKDLVLNNVWNSSVNVNTIYGSLVGEHVVGGNIKIAKLMGEADITNDYADFHIGELWSNFKYVANDGLLEISKAYGQLNVDQKGGTIKIGELGNNSRALNHVISSGKASLTVDSLRDSVEATSTDGNITMVGNKEDNQRVLAVVNSKNGAVKLTNIDGSVQYQAKDGNSSIYVEYANFVGLNTFLNKSGKIEVVMPYDKNPAMWVRWETNKSASINIPGCESTLKLSSADPRCFVQGGVEYGISINDANTSTAEALQIASQSAEIVVSRKSRV